MYCVDFGESFVVQRVCIDIRKMASINPRTSLVKFVPLRVHIIIIVTLTDPPGVMKTEQISMLGMHEQT